MKNKKLFVLFLIIILADALVVALWFFLYSGISKEKRDINEIVQEMTLFETNTQNLRNLKRQTEETGDAPKMLDSAFVGKQDIVSLLDFTEKLGSNIGVAVEFTSVKFDDAKNEKPRLQLELEGNFEKIFRFIVLLENFPNQIMMENLNLKKKEDGGAWQAEAGVILAGYMPEKK
jgi:Tfp pilus assembly protein PilO